MEITLPSSSRNAQARFKESGSFVQKLIYSFGAVKTEGEVGQKLLLGGKGANLAEMTRLGFPVPPGFTISTDVCTHFYANKGEYPAGLEAQVRDGLALMESCLKKQGSRFGDAENPLLVSVRSGAPVSMPGMMDTVLNLGLNDTTVKGLIAQTGNERFAYDAYRRFVQMYSDVVLGVHSNYFETALEELKAEHDISEDSELSAENLRALVQTFKLITATQSGKPFPENPMQQLWGAIAAVFSSWMSPRAITYRRINAIPESYGTAVTVQAMVYGNMGSDSATGVAFTRDPSSGKNIFFGEFLVNAQGEDVVAGIRTPQPINEASRNDSNQGTPTLESLMPAAYAQLVDTYQKLELHYHDMQDIEFTIQKGELFLLQTRSGKRTAAAAVKIAVDMVKEKLISKAEACLRVSPAQLDQLLHPRLDPNAPKNILATGLPASPGAVSGKLVFDPDTAERWVKEKNEKVILIRIETSPEDIHGMHVAEGILTARGGMTSHAAVVARGMGKTCVAGCSALNISYERREVSIGGQILTEGTLVTLDGTAGQVILGKVPLVVPELHAEFSEFMAFVDAERTLRVRTNADTPQDAKVARSFGAEGIGLCRTEHMFFDATRIGAVREMILSDNKIERERALAKLLPMQRQDFVEILREMRDLPVTIRLLDPPLHEFLPHSRADLEVLAREMEVGIEVLERRRELLHEFNPMLGHRGCRLGISYPEIYRMQVRAIAEAVCLLAKESPELSASPEIMIPLIADWRELQAIRLYCQDEIRKVETEQGISVPHSIGTMIELPRAALTADQLVAEGKGEAKFFSFGTNDLTQTTFGLSRDDSGSFLGTYVDQQLFAADPFVSVDREGVGELMRIAVNKARAIDAKFKVGICGEQGGEAKTVEFCHELKLDYVSCSPYRVPIARLAAAQAAVRSKA